MNKIWIFLLFVFAYLLSSSFTLPEKQDLEIWNRFAKFNDDFDKYEGNNLIWFSKVKGRIKLVKMSDRFGLGDQVEFNIGIKLYDTITKKIQFLTKEYYGDWGTYVADNTYNFDSSGKLLGIGYKAIYFQCSCNKNDNTKDNRTYKVSNKNQQEIKQIARTMFNENGKPLDSTRCDNPWFESPEVYQELAQILNKYQFQINEAR